MKIENYKGLEYFMKAWLIQWVIIMWISVLFKSGVLWATSITIILGSIILFMILFDIIEVY
jgi:hypothetical protein